MSFEILRIITIIVCLGGGYGICHLALMAQRRTNWLVGVAVLGTFFGLLTVLGVAGVKWIEAESMRYDVAGPVFLDVYLPLIGGVVVTTFGTGVVALLAFIAHQLIMLWQRRA